MGVCLPNYSGERLQAMWLEIATRFFDDRLPPIRIEWSARLTASSGMFVSNVGPRSRAVSLRERHGASRCIRLSAPLLGRQPEAEVLRTLAHEMIHQWQFDVKKRRPNHGADFRDMMNRMNREGLAITIHHALRDQVERFSRYRWECVACGMTYDRQRRTISPRRHRCGRCHGELSERRLLTERSQERRSAAAPSMRFMRRDHGGGEPMPVQLAFEFDA